MYLAYKNGIINMDNVVRIRADYENLIVDCINGKSHVIGRYDSEQEMDNAIQSICVGIHNDVKCIILQEEKEENDGKQQG